MKFLRFLIWGVLVVTAVVIVAVIGSVGQSRSQSLLEARKGFSTKLLSNESDPVFSADVPPADIYQLVYYPSSVGRLAAYVSPDPHDGRKHPALIWAHGGFGGIGSPFFTQMPELNDQSPHFFQESGIVVMTPSWRGENDNPGHKEMFFGEVQDALAAIQYVRSLPYVDTSRIYFAGHSTGGTMALLAAEASPDLRATFSFGATVDLRVVDWAKPYDTSNPDEDRLRSVIDFTVGIKSPAFCLEGSRSGNCTNFPVLQRVADGEKAPLHTFIVHHGTHFNILHPLTELVAKKILADTGPNCAITLTQGELDKSFSDFMLKEAMERTTPLVTVSPEAAEYIKSRAADLHVDADNVFLRISLDASDRIMTSLVLQAQTDDTQIDSQGVHLLLARYANQYLEPFTLGLDKERQNYRIEPPPPDK